MSSADYHATARLNLEQSNNLVFSGGSVKGIAHVGALYALKKLGFDFQRIRGVAGTSAGSITALAVALNLLELESTSANSLLDILVHTNFASFVKEGFSASRGRLLSVKSQWLPSKLGTGSSVYSELQLSSNLGLSPASELRAWVEAIVHSATGIANCTFEELKEKRSSSGRKLFKDLRVVGYNLSTGTELIFSACTTPNAIISDAVRISVAIPVLFTPGQYWVKQDEKRVLFNEPEGAENDLWIDGGVVNNYPIDVFNGEGATFGFYLTTGDKKRAYETRSGQPGLAGTSRVKISTVSEFRKALYKAGTDLGGQCCGHWKTEVGPGRARTLYIDNKGVDTLDFELGTKEKNLLLRSGAESVWELYSDQAVQLQDLCESVNAEPGSSRGSGKKVLGAAAASILEWF